MFKSLRASIVTITAFAIVLVSTVLLWIATNVYESLYSRSAVDDLDALSDNLAIDLIPYMASDKDIFAISNQLLRLDKYDNVEYAAVFDENRTLILPYVGHVVMRLQEQRNEDLQLADKVSLYHTSAIGMQENDDNSIAFKVIGESEYPLGYLLIVNDLTIPLTESKQELVLAVLPLMALMLIIVIIVFVGLQNHALRPLTELSAFMQKIKSTKDYALTTEVKGKSEIAMLTEGFNDMMQTINTEVIKNKEQTETLLLQREQMEKLANFDTLTNLPNRQFFLKILRVALAHAQKEHTDLAIMFFDLDGFKPVNDSFGHDVGDELLRQIAIKIKDLIREGDVVARLGGDEFLLLLTGAPDDETLYTIANRLIYGLSEPCKIDQWEVKIGLSIGIARASDAEYQMSKLISNADLAMYKSKTNGRSQFSVFSSDMVEGNRRNNLIANYLSRAITNNEFTLNYQAKVNKFCEVQGYEALVRWQCEELGNVPPAEFIPIAEQSGKITAITQWVFRQVCKDLHEISSEDDKIVVSLNLSVHDLKNESLESDFHQVMREFDINPRQIEFEITETAYLENFERANSFFNNARELGCKIALDDFGTGYSSLGYLTQISIDTLKIDKQFVDRIGLSKRSAVITKTIIEMAKQLDLKVCAEGVETAEQMAFLVDNDCHLLQGYLFAKPVPLSQLTSTVEHS